MNHVAQPIGEDRADTPLRRAITDAASLSEPDALAPLLDRARLEPDDEAAVRGMASRLVAALRSRGTRGPVEALMREYALSSAEGIALMCLAEALLRTPDAATRDALIRDRVGAGDWRAHLGRSPSLFVNAASWGLLVTGSLTATAGEAGLARALGAVLQRGGQPVIRRALDLAMRLMGEHFVLGQNIDQALNRARPWERRGFRYSYDMLGEGAVTAADAERYGEDYRRAIERIGAAATGDGPLTRPGISVKLSALHPRYVRSQRARVLAELGPRLADLARRADRHRIGLNIDAEEADRLDLSLDLLEQLCFDPSIEGRETLGFVVQAYGKRATAVIDHLADLGRRSGRRLMIRLVKGAYWDSEIKRAQEAGLPEFPVFTRKAHTDISYVGCARRMLAAPDAIYPQFATHNARTVATIMRLAGPEFRPGDYEFQCLHGMGEALYEEVVGPGKLDRPCRIYAPVGTHETLLAYLVRRLLENGANTSFVNRVGDSSIPPEQLAEDPRLVALANDPPGSPHPAIRHPADLFAPLRRNARGIDLSSETVRAGLETVLRTTAADDRDPPIADTDPSALDAIVGRARAAAPLWAGRTGPERATTLRRAADELERQTEQLLALFAREAGKTAPNAIAEIREAVDFLRFYAVQADTFDPARDRPLGVAACISPWNFPLAIFTGQLAAALAAGNAVIAKPAEQTPLIAVRAVRILHDAGIPPDALALVAGDGTLGAALVAHPAIDAVMFTGSAAAARSIAQTLAARTEAHGRPIPLVAETGGQNAMIVDSSALAEQVVADVLASAFDSAGQRCSALRILCLQDDVAPRILELLKGAMDELALGDPARLDTDIGPVITTDAARAVEAHLVAMQAAGLAVHRGGRLPARPDPRLVRPALVELDRIDRLAGEVFGPVLHVVRYERDQLDAVLRAVDATGYALTFGVHTRLDDTAARAEAGQSAGNVYVNRNMVGAVVGSQPFGGGGLSGTGPKAGGPLTVRRLLATTGPLEPSLAGTPPERARAFATLLAETGHDPDGSLARLLAATPYGARLELPGPVGERNVYTLEPRGPVLCRATTEAGGLAQLAAVLATGNDPVIESGFPCATAYRAFAAHAGTASLQAALHEGDAASLGALARDLAAREGPIVTIHSPPYAPEFLLRERVVTTNTAAAGGNASLMAIG